MSKKNYGYKVYHPSFSGYEWRVGGKTTTYEGVVDITIKDGLVKMMNDKGVVIAVIKHFDKIERVEA